MTSQSADVLDRILFCNERNDAIEDATSISTDGERVDSRLSRKYCQVFRSRDEVDVRLDGEEELLIGVIRNLKQTKNVWPSYKVYIYFPG